MIQGYVKSGTVRLIKGDALVQDDVQHAWDEAARGGDVDLLLFTVGEPISDLLPNQNIIPFMSQVVLPNSIPLKAS